MALGAQNGGFTADSWGWVALPLLLVPLLVVAVTPAPSLTRAEAALLGALALLVAWTALSGVWAPEAGAPVVEAERALLFLAALAAVLLAGARFSPSSLAIGVLIATTVLSTWSIWGRLFPDSPIAGRLAGPIGYANGLGLVAAVGTLLAVGFSTRHASFAAVPVVLVPTLAFTFGRGAWLALAAGGIVLVGLEALRGGALHRLAGAVPAPTLAAWLAHRSPALTQTGHTLAQTRHDGHLLAIELTVLAIVSPIAVHLAGRANPPRPGRRFAVAVVAAVLAGIAALGILAARHSGGSSGSNLNARLLSLSSSGRGDYWRAALDEARAHPALGGGAGTWSRWWLLRRPDTKGALDAHELYLETLAELGPAGLLLLLCVLAVPFLVLRHALRAPPAAACAAGYVAVLVAAALDWDWELPAVMLTGLFCGAAVVAAAGGKQVVVRGRVRLASFVVAGCAGAAVVVLQVGNAATAAASSALDAGNAGKAAHDARRAERWQPWATLPQLELGEAQLAAGDVDTARRTFAAVLRRDPRDADAWYQLALASTGAERSRVAAHARLLDPHGPAASLK